MPIAVEVAGSSGVVYAVRAVRVGDRLVVTCTCEAGQKHMACRHRLALLSGDCAAVIGDANAAAAIAAWLAGSNIEAALRDLAAAEAEAEAAKRHVSAMKRRLGRLLDGG